MKYVSFPLPSFGAVLLAFNSSIFLRSSFSEWINKTKSLPSMPNQKLSKNRYLEKIPFIVQ
jgi:hypothetical protein